MTYEYLIALMKKEFATTLRVMRAYPSDQMSWKPHERSSSAEKLMSTFVFEMYLLRSYLLGDTVEPSVFQKYANKSHAEIIADFESETAHVLKELEGLGAAGMTKEVSFAKKSYTGADFTLMMLSDQIHHRGQLSVYVRMAGGKVPAIYGPSADDPGTNL